MNTDYLAGWDAEAEQRKSDFMYHLYDESDRDNGLLTSLWTEFVEKCGGVDEANKARDAHFGLK